MSKPAKPALDLAHGQNALLAQCVVNPKREG